MGLSSDDAPDVDAGPDDLSGLWSTRHRGSRPASAWRLGGATHGYELWLPHEARGVAATPLAELVMLASLEVEALRPWERRELRGHDDALGCLEPLFRAGGNLDPLRRVVASFGEAAEVWREDDAGLKSQLAALLLTRRLWLMRRQPVRTRGNTSSPQPAPLASAMTPSMMRERPSESSVAPPPAPEADFPIDQYAQALALIRAAKDGVPFCEECQRLRNAQGLDPYEVAQQEAQVAALMEAAEEGLPFCEECERAKQAQARERQREEEMA